MRIRTVRFILKEGLINTYKNKLMSASSVVIVIATLVIFGFFMLFVLNLETNMNELKEQPQLEVFCDTALDETQVKQIEEQIAGNELVGSYQTVSKAEALEKMKLRLGENASTLEGYDENIFPVSYIIKLDDYTKSREAMLQFKEIPGVDKVSYSQDTIDMITGISYWIKLISSIMIGILVVVSVFIISNTIKLTVFARRKEINIMKYVGATDWFIRWPFIVEGVIIGVLGAAGAFFVTAYGYTTLVDSLSSGLYAFETDFFAMIDISNIRVEIFSLFLAIGGGVGAIGSYISLRRHLKV